MSLTNFYPHRCGRHFWDVFDWPQNVFNQHFGLDLEDDIFRPSVMLSIPQRRQELAKRSGASEVINTENKFEVKLDCSHFTPEEISVKTVDNNIVINGKHEEKMDNHGFISRSFTRRYALPEECDAQEVISCLNSNGVLTISAPKKPLEPLKDNERVVPINVLHESQNTNEKQIEN